MGLMQLVKACEVFASVNKFYMKDQIVSLVQHCGIF